MELNSRPLNFATAGPTGEDIMKWSCSLEGPKETPYEGGTFRVKLKFPDEYPFKPPTAKFLTKIYHPNVTLKDGEVCPELLTENWKPHLNIRYVLECLRGMLAAPNAAKALDEGMGHEYMENLAGFNTKAANYTKKHAQ